MAKGYHSQVFSKRESVRKNTYKNKYHTNQEIQTSRRMPVTKLYPLPRYIAISKKKGQKKGKKKIQKKKKKKVQKKKV